MTELGALDQISQGFAINSVGQVVGWSDDRGEARSVMVEGDRMKDLRVKCGSRKSEAHAINSLGQIAGLCEDELGRSGGFLWGKHKTTVLSPLDGTSAGAWGINSLGQVVGYSEVVANEGLFQGGSLGGRSDN
jgi:uncharacterized membrane protein